MSVNGASCPAALLFANQRGANQQRITTSQRNSPFLHYLEGINFDSFGAGTAFSGPETFELVSEMQPISQDIVRCARPAFVTVQSPGLNAAGLPQLANYSPTTRTLTLGQVVVGSALNSSVSNFLYGCAWRPEPHTLGSGLRSYFTFRIKFDQTSLSHLSDLVG